jgi:hypothetical protein
LALMSLNLLSSRYCKLCLPRVWGYAARICSFVRRQRQSMSWDGSFLKIALLLHGLPKVSSFCTSML